MAELPNVMDEEAFFLPPSEDVPAPEVVAGASNVSRIQIECRIKARL